MSWNISISGKDREKIKELVNAEQHLPQELKDLFCTQVSTMKLSGDEFGVSVRSTGHRDMFYCYGDFKIEATRLV